jgi:trk system potassium uptake protein TrkA
VKLVVIGCGRVGASVAREFQEDGWDVTAVDEKQEALDRLGADWPGGFIVGHGMDSEILRRAGVPEADAVVVSTNGDNTNLVIGQVVKMRYDVECVVVRILDPARAQFYEERGMQVVCPTKTAIAMLAQTVRKTTAGVQA